MIFFGRLRRPLGYAPPAPPPLTPKKTPTHFRKFDEKIELFGKFFNKKKTPNIFAILVENRFFRKNIKKIFTIFRENLKFFGKFSKSKNSKIFEFFLSTIVFFFRKNRSKCSFFFQFFFDFLPNIKFYHQQTSISKEKPSVKTNEFIQEPILDA